MVCYFPPDGGIWASGTMVEAEVAVAAVEAVVPGAAPAKMTASGVA